MTTTPCRIAAAVLAAFAAGCTLPPAEGPAASRAQPDAGRCAAAPVRLVESAPAFTGFQPAAALDGTLSPGRVLHLCEVRGGRQEVLLPGRGEPADCTRRPPAQACERAWIPRGTRVAPLR